MQERGTDILIVGGGVGGYAAALTACCLEKDLTPRQVHQAESHLRDFQRVLVAALGFELAWPEYARVTPR